jgi:hypothetical protein
LVRLVVLAITLVFIAALGVLTVLDFVNNGVSALGILALLIVALFSIGIVGALRHPPEE